MKWRNPFPGVPANSHIAHIYFTPWCKFSAFTNNFTQKSGEYFLPLLAPNFTLEEFEYSHPRSRLVKYVWICLNTFTPGPAD